MPTMRPRSCRCSTRPRKISRASQTSPKASAATSISARNQLSSERRVDQLDGVVACPLGGTRNRSDLASLRIDQQRGRHAERAANGLEVLKTSRGGIGVVSEL